MIQSAAKAAGGRGLERWIQYIENGKDNDVTATAKNLSLAFQDEPAETPHPKSVELADQGLEEWSRGLPEEDAEALVDTSAGKAVRWVPGEGWVEEKA